MGGVAVSRSMNRLKRYPPKRTPAASPATVKNSTDISMKKKNRSITAGARNTVKQSSGLVMGSVKILKRGEVLDDTKPSTRAAEEDLNGAEAVLSSSANRSRNFPISDRYAGSVFNTSPEPSSVPLPGFLFFQKNKSSVNNVTNTDNIATDDLLRLLRII